MPATTQPPEALYDRLAAPFEQTAQIRRGNTALDYLTGEQVVSRLTAVLGLDGWEFEIREHGRSGDTLWALGRLTVHLPTRTVVREQFGECVTQRGMAEGDSLKGAATDALKKCATLVGVGLYLSGKTEGLPHRAADERPEPPANVTRLAARQAPEAAALKALFPEPLRQYVGLGQPAAPTPEQWAQFWASSNLELGWPSREIEARLGGHPAAWMEHYGTTLRRLWVLLKAAREEEAAAFGEGRAPAWTLPKLPAAAAEA